jgi:riboflavin synthase
MERDKRGDREAASMFTGIVEETGRVVAVEDEAGGRRLRIGTTFEGLEHGESISVSGVCLTVERTVDESFEVFLAAETVEKTYLGELAEGDRVNLERALPAEGRFDGHLVQGHVDTTTEVTGVERVGDDWWFEFALPAAVARYVVQKGSVALDGISLTVAERGDEEFAVAIIPTTYELTTLSEKSVGDPVHLEVDVVAKYVESLVDGYR